MNCATASVSFQDGPEYEVILIVEPDAYYRTLLARGLLDEGFEVRSPETIDRDTEKPRLAIVNLEDLEEEDADVLLADLLGPHRDIPVILRSSNPGELEESARMLGLNVALSLAKDTADEEVVARVVELLPRGALASVPVLGVPRDELGWFEVDPDREAFLESVDGQGDLEAIATRTGLEPSVITGLAATLVGEGIIALI
jgi:DNA-binding response OmpR family regulator